MQASKSAKTWCWVSFGSGLAFGILYILFVIVVAFLGSQ